MASRCIARIEVALESCVSFTAGGIQTALTKWHALMKPFKYSIFPSVDGIEEQNSIEVFFF